MRPRVLPAIIVHGMSMLLHVSMSGDTELAGYLYSRRAALALSQKNFLYSSKAQPRIAAPCP